MRNRISSGTGTGILPAMLARYGGNNPLQVARGIDIVSNHFTCGAGSVILEALGISASIAGNFMSGSTLAGIVVSGTTAPGLDVLIEHNQIQTTAAGVIFSTDRIAGRTPWHGCLAGRIATRLRNGCRR